MSRTLWSLSLPFPFSLSVPFLLPLSLIILKETRGLKSKQEGVCRTVKIHFFLADFYCHDFDRDRKRSIWNELEPTTWRQPNHKIKLWDYQNLGREKKVHFQTCEPLFFSLTPSQIWLYHISKRGGVSGAVDMTDWLLVCCDMRHLTHHIMSMRMFSFLMK